MKVTDINKLIKDIDTKNALIRVNCLDSTDRTNCFVGFLLLNYLKERLQIKLTMFDVLYLRWNNY